MNSTSYKSATVATSSNPDFQDCEISIPAVEGLAGATYVRIAIYIGSHSENLGSIFVPISSFTVAETNICLPLVRFKKMRLLGAGAPDISIGDIPSGLGQLNVRILKEFITFADPNESVFKVRLKSTLRENSVMNCTWFAECLLPTSIEGSAAVKDVENVELLASFDGMLLLESNDGGSAQLDSTAAEDEKDEIETEKNSLDRRSLPVIQRLLSKSDCAPAVMEVVVFQNERRIPGSNKWTTSMNRKKPHFSDLSCKVRYKFGNLNDAVLPDGFTWLDEKWEIDRRYGSEDPDGWRYDAQFSNMTSEDKPTTAANVNKLARRRKWIRKAALINRDSREDIVGDKILFNANSFAAANNQSGESRRKSVNMEALNSNDWRRDLCSSKQGPLVVVGACKEKASPSSPAIIPWSQVLSVTVVTPSVLSVRFVLNRFFPDSKEIGKGAFRRAEIEMFVSNCPAYDLWNIMDERTSFSQTRESIRQAIVESSTLRQQEEDSNQTQEIAEEEDSELLETEELSLGSEISAELDQYSIDLEVKIRELEDRLIRTMKAQKITKVSSHVAFKEMTFLMRRSSRARLYLAAMLALQLRGSKSCSGFVAQELQDERKIANIAAIEALKFVAQDSERCNKIALDNDVATANNRIGSIPTALYCIQSYYLYANFLCFLRILD